MVEYIDPDTREELVSIIASRYLFAAPADNPVHGQAVDELAEALTLALIKEISDGMICCPARDTAGIVRFEPLPGHERCFFAALAIRIMEVGRQHVQSALAEAKARKELTASGRA